MFVYFIKLKFIKTDIRPHFPVCNYNGTIFILIHYIKLIAMKNSIATLVILKALDLNLKAILEADIKAMRIAQQSKRRAALQLIAA